MILELFTLLVLAFAAFRVTRLVVIDTLFEGTRNKLHSFLVNRTGKLAFFWQKLHDLVSCSWCAGVWISFLLYTVYVWNCPVDWTRFDWINVSAIAGIQGFLHELEPE